MSDRGILCRARCPRLELARVHDHSGQEHRAPRRHPSDIMSQPSPQPIHESETASPPRVSWPRPPYHGLRRKIAYPDGAYVSMGGGATSRATSESAASESRSPSPSVTPSESSNHYAASISSWATSAGPGTEFAFPNDDETERCGHKWDEEYVSLNSACH